MSKGSTSSLKTHAEAAITEFLETLDGETCVDLYAMVIEQVEEPVLKAVMEYNLNNQSKAAAMLGLNRGTLRKKLRQWPFSKSHRVRRKFECG